VSVADENIDGIISDSEAYHYRASIAR